MRSLVRPLGVMVLGAALVTAACSQPASPADTSPGMLDVKISVLDVYPKQNDLAVVMQFLSGGQAVKFASGETVTCNNVSLAFNGLVSAYSGRVAQVGAGGKYRFVYTRQGTQTTVEVTAPPRPVILNPLTNAQVPRTTNLTITYTPAGGDAVEGGASDASASAGSPGEQPDNGHYSGLDVSSLKAGGGSVSLTRILRFTDSSTAFKSVAVEYRVSTDQSVTWT